MSASVSPSMRAVFSRTADPESFSNSARTKSRPVTVRFSAAEFARLEDQAAGQSLSGYVRGRLFEGPAPRKRRGKYSVQDKVALAQVLAMLGKIGASSDLSELAEGVRLGTLPVSDEVEAQIVTACTDLFKIKALLMAALGISED